MAEESTKAPPRPHPRKKRRARSHHASSLSSTTMRSEINVTPLVDVVLVLLIIFMVVTPMLSRGVKVDLPETVHHDQHEDAGEIIVSIAADGQAYVGTDLASDGNLVALMQRALRGKSREVHLKADRSLEYGRVRRVLERLHEAGAAKIALGTEEKKERAE